MQELHLPAFYPYLVLYLGALWFGGMQIIACTVAGWLCGVYSRMSITRGILCGFGVGIVMVAVIFIANALLSGLLDAGEWVGQVVAPMLTLVGGPYVTIRCCAAWSKIGNRSNSGTP